MNGKYITCDLGRLLEKDCIGVNFTFVSDWSISGRLLSKK